MATTRTRKPRKPRAYCTGSGRFVAGAIPPATVHDCPVCYRESIRVKTDGTLFKHYRKAPVTKSDPAHQKRILELYGITGEEYEQLLRAQDGKCYICEKPPRAKRLAVDHDHTKGNTREAVRGLLCRRCNHRLLGSAHDATRILKRAIEYLENPPAWKVLRT